MLPFSRRIAVRCALLFLLIGLMIGASCLHASAQEISPATIREFARPPVPIFQKYVPWATGAGLAGGPKKFAADPATTGLTIGIGMVVILTMIVMKTVRPRQLR